MSKKALSGLKVVEYGHFISAPYCTKLMADMGAEVIKIEQPSTGDESRYHGPFPDDLPHPEKSGLFLYLNTNKMSITLDVGTAKGREILEKILKDTDIFVENNPPQMINELKLDYPRLKKLNPHLIVTSITTYGQTGPYRDYKGYAINCCAFGGVSQSLGQNWREPLTFPMSMGHYLAAINGAAATMVAILARDITNSGQHIDIAEADIWASHHVGFGVTLYTFIGREHLRNGYLGGGWTYPTGRFIPCKDGYMALCAPQVKYWKQFIELMGNPEWSQNPRYRDRRAMEYEYPEEVDALLTPWFLERTKQEHFKFFEEHAIPFAPLYNMEDEVNDPHLTEREFFTDIDHDAIGRLKYPGPPYRFSKTQWSLERPAPKLGENNEEIYCDRLGYSKKDFVELRKAKVI
ncbi:MAG: CoA transferase [Dehalococcoidia bacterium]|nr:MAG: CoA transferase [Dehalococcoidia bacterium]